MRDVASDCPGTCLDRVGWADSFPCQDAREPGTRRRLMAGLCPSFRLVDGLYSDDPIVLRTRGIRKDQSHERLNESVSEEAGVPFIAMRGHDRRLVAACPAI